MAKYVVVAKCLHEGTSTDDRADPLSVTELATELVITRLRLIELLNTGAVDRDWVVVTAPDRVCLYQNTFPHVVSYGDFVKLGVEPDVDLVSQIYSLCESMAYKPRYARLEEDRHEILDIGFERSEESDPYVCLLVRTRAAWGEKNLPGSYWTGLVDQFLAAGLKVFVFGKETECYAVPGVEHVSTVSRWCGLLANEHCRAVVSTVSGGVYPIFFVGHGRSKLVVVDNTGLLPIHGHDPSFYDSCINFTGTRLVVFDRVPEYSEVVEEVARA